MQQWTYFTPAELKPQGWLLRQLRLQANGLSGNLDRVWPDVKNSAWIGGDAEERERVPYWLDGFVPLAYLLDDDDMKARAKGYMDYILAHQQPGWLDLSLSLRQKSPPPRFVVGGTDVEGADGVLRMHKG